MVSPTQIPEFYIRQPFVKPLGESRDFKDVVCDLANKMGFPLGFNSAEEFVKLSCEKTPGVKVPPIMAAAISKNFLAPSPPVKSMC